MGKTKTKIAIISSSLSEGGAERFAGLLSVILDESGYEIHNVIINDAVDYDYRGTLHNLGKSSSNGIYRKIEKSFLLEKCLRENQIDIIIDNRPRNHFFRDLTAKLIFGNRRVFYIVHSFKVERYIPKSVFLARILYASAEKIVCVSNAIENKIKREYKLKNTTTIYNPVHLPEIGPFENNSKNEMFVLFFGRLEEKVKNFSLMIEALKMSGIAESGYKLKIMGTGPDAEFIADRIAKSGLSDDAEIIPFRKNPFELVKQARFTILTSHFEGFPMSLIESLAVGTPVVSVNCESGPAEIIRNESNGLLVPNHDAAALANAMRRFVEDGNLYDICKHNAAQSVAHLSVQNIAGEWQRILSLHHDNN